MHLPLPLVCRRRHRITWAWPLWLLYGVCSGRKNDIQQTLKLQQTQYE
jgi:hypothetical protein